MDNQNNQTTQKKGRDLTPDEKLEMRIGQELYETTQTAGWRTLRKWLDDRAYHSWVDPRGMNKEEWMFAEMGGFFAADAAKQFIIDLQKAVDRSEYLAKVASGEIQEGKSMRF